MHISHGDPRLALARKVGFSERRTTYCEITFSEGELFRSMG